MKIRCKFCSILLLFRKLHEKLCFYFSHSLCWWMFVLIKVSFFGPVLFLFYHFFLKLHIIRRTLIVVIRRNNFFYQVTAYCSCLYELWLKTCLWLCVCWMSSMFPFSIMLCNSDSHWCWLSVSFLVSGIHCNTDITICATQLQQRP